VSEGDPLTIRLLVEALQDGTLSPGALTHLLPGLEAYVRNWLAELEQHSEQNPAIYTLLGLCATALGPLTSDDIQQLAPEVFTRKITLRQAADRISRFIIGNGSDISGYVFSHPRLREIFFEEALSRGEREEFEKRFVIYGQAWFTSQRSAVPAYLRQFWILHLTKSGAWGLAQTVLTDVGKIGGLHVQLWAETRSTVEGSYAGYLRDLGILWGHAEEKGDVILTLRCALITSSIRSLSNNIPPELLVGLVKVGTPTGKWSASAVLEHIRQMPSSEHQEKVWRTLVENNLPISWEMALEIARTSKDKRLQAQMLKHIALHLSPNQHHLTHEEVMEAAGHLEYSNTEWKYIWPNTEILEGLARHVPAEQRSLVYTQALKAARGLREAEYRAEGLGYLSQSMPAEQQPFIIMEALEIARTITEHHNRAKVLAKIARCLPAEQQSPVYAEALEATRAISDDRHRADVLQLLAPYLHPPQQSLVYREALRAARAVTRRDDYKNALFGLVTWFTQTLIELASHFPQEQQQINIEALESANAIPDPWDRAVALGAVAVRLPSEQQPLVYAKALDAARTTPEINALRAKALAQLAIYLPPAQQRSIREDALEAIRGSEYDQKWEVLWQLIPYLPLEEQQSVYAEALDASRMIDDKWELSRTLLQLASCLSTEQSAETLNIIRSTSHPLMALKQLAPYLPPEQQLLIYTEALEIARSLHYYNDRIKELIQLAPYLPVEQQPLIYTEVLDAARGISDGLTRADTLQQLAPYLPVEQQPLIYIEALDAARTSVNDQRAKSRLFGGKESLALTLAKLASHLPLELQSQVYAEALVLIRDIKEPERRVVVLQKMAPYLPVEQQPLVFTEALDAARDISNGLSRADALQQIAPHLPPEQRRLIYAEALDTVRTTVNARRAKKASQDKMGDIFGGKQSLALSMAKLASHLPLEQQSQVYAEALVLVRDIKEPERRVIALQQIAPHLPPEQQPLVFTEALDAARSVWDEWGRSEALGHLAPFLPKEQRILIYGEALDTIRTSSDDRDLINIVTQLAPFIPVTLLAKALEVTNDIFDDSMRHDAFVSLVPRVITLPASNWHLTLRSLVFRGRPALLRDLEALAPWLIVLTPSEQRSEIAQAIIDISRSWP
jgi:hypothetical protein